VIEGLTAPSNREASIEAKRFHACVEALRKLVVEPTSQKCASRKYSNLSTPHPNSAQEAVKADLMKWVDRF
jgi:hypothetical protein